MPDPPPVPVPWIDTLPTVTAEEMTDGYFLFDGVGQGTDSSIYRPILKMENDTQHLISSSASSYTVWRYNEVIDQLIANGRNSNGLNQNIQEQIGTQHRGTLIQNVQLTKEMIIGKVYPIEP